MKRKPRAKAATVRHGDHYHPRVIVRLPDGSEDMHFDSARYTRRQDALNHARAWRMNILDIEQTAEEWRGKTNDRLF